MCKKQASLTKAEYVNEEKFITIQVHDDMDDNCYFIRNLPSGIISFATNSGDGDLEMSCLWAY